MEVEAAAAAVAEVVVRTRQVSTIVFIISGVLVLLLTSIFWHGTSSN